MERKKAGNIAAVCRRVMVKQTIRAPASACRARPPGAGAAGHQLPFVERESRLSWSGFTAQREDP